MSTSGVPGPEGLNAGPRGSLTGGSAPGGFPREPCARERSRLGISLGEAPSATGGRDLRGASRPAPSGHSLRAACEYAGRARLKAARTMRRGQHASSPAALCIYTRGWLAVRTDSAPNRVTRKSSMQISRGVSGRPPAAKLIPAVVVFFPPGRGKPMPPPPKCPGHFRPRASRTHRSRRCHLPQCPRSRA